MDRPTPDELRIAPADPLAPESLQLAAALWAELSAIYPEQTAPPFPPRDIVGDRAIFLVASLGENRVGCGAVRPLPVSDAVAAAVSAATVQPETITVPAGDTPASPAAGLADVAEIKRMYVAPAARGRGIAAAILRELENWARPRGYERVQLETGGRQPIAIHLYEQSGYSRIPCYAHHAADPLAICFEKLLLANGT